MTDRAEIERLLNQTGRTLEGLPEYYPEEQAIKVFKETVKHGGLWENKLLHQSDVIELLVAALRDALDKQPKWISVKDRLPEADGEYLVLKRHNYRMDDGYMAQEVALFLRTRDPEWVVGNLMEVTHWMPLPEPPKEEEK